MKIIENQKLNEMSIHRDKAFERCLSLGNQFIEHFDKIYQGNLKGIVECDSHDHYTKEMQSFYNQTYNLKLKQNNKQISMVDYSDWFLTAGSSPELKLHNNQDEVDKYVKFIEILIVHHYDIDPYQIKDALKEVGLYE